MRKVRGAFAVALLAGSLSVGAAPPAHASCDTELGDMCKFMDWVCEMAPGSQKVIAYCRP